MVVEDEPDVRLLIKLTLARDPRLGVEGEASTAEEALELLKSRSVGLVILDHMLEGEMSGIEAAPLMKAIAPDTKILLFSALQLSKEVAAEPAIDAYLLKTQFDQLIPTCLVLLGLDPV